MATSTMAWVKSTGASCGRLWPTPPRTNRCTLARRFQTGLLRCDFAHAGDRKARDDFIRCHDRACIVGKIDFERGAHHVLGVVRYRVLDDGHVIAKFGGEAHCSLYAGVGDESDDDQALNAVPLKLQVQVGVGEAAGTPVFAGDHSPGAGTNSARNCPPHVPNSKLLFLQPAFWIGAA